MKPKQVTDIQLAFPTAVENFLPRYADLPNEFRRGHGSKWNEIVARWFFSGLPKGTEFVVKAGIDKDAALRHIRYCMGSWEPQHEHKEAGCAYLLSLWFDDVVIPTHPISQAEGKGV